MNLATKRQVIRLLLCGAKGGCATAALMLGASRATATLAAKARQRAMNASRGSGRFIRGSFEQWGLEAAYHLIESSPTLIREYFERSVDDDLAALRAEVVTLVKLAQQLAAHVGLA